jgi:hypothetical protein
VRASSLFAAAVLICCAAAHASAHRLDEYLLDTTFSVHPNRIEAEMRLTPGVNVARAIIGKIDTDGDGRLSDSEQQGYARRVLADVALSLDGKPMQPRLLSATFPEMQEMGEGVGEIVLRFDAAIPAGGGTNCRLVFENRHEKSIAAHLVNCLVPSEPTIRIAGQHRNVDQSRYELEYEQRDQAAATSTALPRSPLFYWLAADAVAIAAVILTVARRRARRATTGANQ